VLLSGAMANTVFHITGTSRGIGKSLVDFIVNSNLEALKVQHVYGYARSNQDTRHPSFIPCKV
jgi:short-subunit dehydrogenase